MSDKIKEHSSHFGLGSVMWMLFFPALAYLLWGLSAAVATFVYSIVLLIMMLFGLVPIVGPIIYWWLTKTWVEPQLLALGHIQANIVWDIMWYFGFAGSVILTGAMTFFLLMVLVMD